MSPASQTTAADAASGLPGRVLRSAYLGSFQEVTVATALGEIFVISGDTAAHWRPDQSVTLTLGRQGVAVLEGA